MQETMIRVWDIPTRLFHWSLVLLFGALWVSGELGGRAMRYHEIFGFLLLALVVTRVLWGLVGSRTARFSDFMRGPRTTLAYLAAVLRGRPPASLGHNPLGGWMVLTLLVLLLAQASSGLFATDDIAFDGPLNYLVHEHTAKLLTRFHHLDFRLLLLLAGVHLLAVAIHRLRFGDDLVRPMLSGRKPVPPGWQGPPPALTSAWRALILFGVVAGGLYFAIFHP